LAAAALWVMPAFAAITPSITSISNPVFVGDSFTIKGSGFTAGSVANFFVAKATGPHNFGPLKPSGHSPTSLTVPVSTAKVTSLGQGVVSVVVVNTDQGFTRSNSVTAQLFGDNRDGFPNLTAVNGVGLAATSTDPSFATDNVQTVVMQNHAVTLGGNGFDTVNGVAIDLFCDCPGAKIPTIFLNKGNTGLHNSVLTFTLPADATTGPGSFVVSNKGTKGDYAIKSNAVSVPIGAAVTVSKITQMECTVTVDGTGFAVTGARLPDLTVINLFNREGGAAVNLGGLNAKGRAKIPLNIPASTRFTFSLAGMGFAPGPSYVQVLNPPFVPFTSSGNAPSGAFTARSCPSITPTPSATATGKITPSATRTPTPSLKPTPTRTPGPSRTVTRTPTPVPTSGPTPLIPNLNQFYPALE
jgi:hypothetical protein